MFLVRHWLVLAGLICARCALLLIGISARATLELNGPTTPRTFESLTNCWRFWAPFCGSWTPLTASSRLETSIVKPSTVPAVWTAYLTPFRVGIPSEASAPDSGRSTPILIVPLLAVPPPPLVPQAASATLATARPASNFDNLIELLLPKIRFARVPSPIPEGVALYTTLPTALQQSGESF